MKLPTMPHDKANHFAYGAALAAVGLAVHSPTAGLALCVVFAVGKEIWDSFSKGTPDALDVVATAAGGAVVLLPGVFR